MARLCINGFLGRKQECPCKSGREIFIYRPILAAAGASYGLCRCAVNGKCYHNQLGEAFLIPCLAACRSRFRIAAEAFGRLPKVLRLSRFFSQLVERVFFPLKIVVHFRFLSEAIAKIWCKKRTIFILLRFSQ